MDAAERQDSAPEPQFVPGVLAPPPTGSWRLHRAEPSATVATFVAWLWAVEWDLGTGGPHEQSTLPHPSAHLVVDEGDATIHGPASSRFTRTLDGAGRVVGVRFSPAGLRPFLRSPLSALVDERRPAAAVFPAAGLELVARVEGCSDVVEAMRLVESVVIETPAEPGHREVVERVNEVVALIACDRSITTVGELAARTGLHRRRIQREFAEYVGLGPKSVIRRYRLQEAASAALDGTAVAWADVAARLGYFDQAHLVRDFTATIGTPPAAYARAIAEPPS